MVSRPGDTPRYITADQVPPPRGHYSHAAEANGMVFVSGLLPVDPKQPAGAPLPSFEQQCRQAMANLSGVLAGAGLDLAHVVKVTAYIVGAGHWGLFNEVYAEAFGPCRPARSVVPVPELHLGYLMELEAVAVRPAAAGPRMEKEGIR